MMRIPQHSYYSFFFLLLCALFASPLHAQTSSRLLCTINNITAVCPTTGLADNLGDFTELFEDYTGDLADSFVEAHTIGNLTIMPQVAGMRLNLLTVGGQLSMGWVKRQDQQLSTESGESLENLTSGGLNPQLLFYTGVNIGTLFSLITLGSDVLDNIDLYFGVFTLEFNYTDLLGVDIIEFENKITYLGLRYQLIDSIGLAILAEWLGLSIRGSYINSESNVRLEEEDAEDSNSYMVAGLAWRGFSELIVDSRMQTGAFEINTGLRVLYFLTFTMSYGIAYHLGRTSVLFYREGDIYLNDAQLPGSLIAEVSSKSHLKQWSYHYTKAGVEMNFPFTRIGAELSFKEDGFLGVSLALRLDI